MFCAWLLKVAYLRSFKIVLPPFWLPALLFLLLLAVQLIPMPLSWRSILSPEPLRHSILLPSSPDFKSTGIPSDWVQLTLHPTSTWQGLLDFLSCAIFCWVLLHHLGSKIMRQWVIIFLVGIGIFEAVYGLGEFWSGRQGIFWFAKQYYREEVTGTYINHNHFAGLLAMLVPFTVALLWRSGFSERGGAVARLFPTRPASILVSAILAVMLVSLILSHSRGGLTACAGALLCLGVMLWQTQSQKTVVRRLTLWVVLLVGVISLGFSREIVTRFSYTHRDAPERLGLWTDGLKILQDFPWLGTGLGTFKYVLPNYRTSLDFLTVDGVARQALWNFAHNDYLQLLIECGVIGLSLAVWALFGTLRRILAGRRRCDDPAMSVLSAGALAGVVAILIHSLVDFNLHIPANAFVFSTLLSLALVCSQSEPEAAAS